MNIATSAVVILTHPRNRKYRDQMLQAAERFAKRHNVNKIEVGFDRTLEKRRMVNGQDDGPFFVILFGEQQLTAKLVGPQQKAVR